MKQHLRRLAIAEGASFLVLVGIAMPLKHLAHEPLAVRIVGIIHGILFLAYGVALVEAYATKELSGREAWIAFGAGIVPFAPFALAFRASRPETIPDPSAGDPPAK